MCGYVCMRLYLQEAPCSCGGREGRCAADHFRCCPSLATPWLSQTGSLCSVAAARRTPGRRSRAGSSSAVNTNSAVCKECGRRGLQQPSVSCILAMLRVKETYAPFFLFSQSSVVSERFAAVDCPWYLPVLLCPARDRANPYCHLLHCWTYPVL